MNTPRHFTHENTCWQYSEIQLDWLNAWTDRELAAYLASIDGTLPIADFDDVLHLCHSQYVFILERAVYALDGEVPTMPWELRP